MQSCASESFKSKHSELARPVRHVLDVLQHPRVVAAIRLAKPMWPSRPSPALALKRCTCWCRSSGRLHQARCRIFYSTYTSLSLQLRSYHILIVYIYIHISISLCYVILIYVIFLLISKELEDPETLCGLTHQRHPPFGHLKDSHLARHG